MTTEGTWAWACEQMVKGQTVRSQQAAKGIFRNLVIKRGRIVELTGAFMATARIETKDLTATDWEIVS